MPWGFGKHFFRQIGKITVQQNLNAMQDFWGETEGLSIFAM
jgi:hypothetical protein